jgi:hypothetical protein
MEITERAIHLLAEVARSVQAYYRDFADLAHGWEHVQRVYYLALHLNDIARALHIPQDIGEAAHVIAQGKEQEVDIGVAQPAEQATHPGTSTQSSSVPARVVPQQQAYFAHALVQLSQTRATLSLC